MFVGLQRSAKPCRVRFYAVSVIIIIMEICQVPTIRLKALNMHIITHIMYNEVENVITNFTKKLTHIVDKGSSIPM